MQYSNTVSDLAIKWPRAFNSCIYLCVTGYGEFNPLLRFGKDRKSDASLPCP